MPDTDTPETGDTAAPAAPAGTPATPDRLPDDHPLVKAYQATKGDLAAARQKVKEFEDRDKSDADKAADRLTAAEKRAADAEAALLRRTVADDKGLTAAQAKFLTGTTQEEIEAKADEILEAFPANGASPPPSRRPESTAPAGGTDPTSGTEETDPAKLAASVPRY